MIDAPDFAKVNEKQILSDFEYAKREILPNGQIRVELILRPIPQQSIPERLPPRAKLCFQKVFCGDWKLSERMFEALWADFEREIGHEAGR